VFFGAWVVLEDQDGATQEYRIVGPDEFDPKLGWISMDSPLARALLKRGLDDEVTVETPQGRRSYWVIEIRYDGAS
jgi:transcription elongation factor GreB